MVALGIRRTREITCAILVLAATAGPNPTVSQPVFEPGANDQQRALIETIRERESQRGVNSPELIDPLMALALFYEEQGHDELAAAAIARARAVVRVSYGLYSFEEAPLIRRSMRIEQANGNVEAAWGLEQELLTLAEHNPEELWTVHILREVAEGRRDILRRYRTGELPAQIVLGCYYRERQAPGTMAVHNPERCRSGSKSAAEAALSTEAALLDWTATQAILEHPLYTSGQLRELETEIDRTCRSYRYDRPDACDAEQRVLAALGYEVGSSVPEIDALVRQADWLMGEPCPAVVQTAGRRIEACNDNIASAIALYERAYERLRREGVAQASIDRVFSPALPVTIPPVYPNRLASKQMPEPSKHVDVAFDVTRSGEAENIETLDTTSRATRAARIRLDAAIRGSRFRPRVLDGRLADAAPVVLRYYVKD